MAIVTPITRDPVERAAIERDLAGDPLGAIEIILADTIRRASRIEARLASLLAPAPPAAFRRVVEQQRRERDERDVRRSGFSVAALNAEKKP